MAEPYYSIWESDDEGDDDN